MRRFSWLAIWLLLGVLLTWLSASSIGSVLVALALSYTVVRWWRSRYGRATYKRA